MFQCTNVILQGVRGVDNGSPAFASNTGGNLRIYNCTNTRIIGGIYSGLNTVSYWGIRLDGTNTSIRIAYPFISAANNINDATNLIS
jgi:hypothetical protein